MKSDKDIKKNKKGDVSETPCVWLQAHIKLLTVTFVKQKSIKIWPFQTSSPVVFHPPSGRFQRNLNACKIITNESAQVSNTQLENHFNHSAVIFEILNCFKSSQKVAKVHKMWHTDRGWHCRTDAFYRVQVEDQASKTRSADVVGTRDESVRNAPTQTLSQHYLDYRMPKSFYLNILLHTMKQTIDNVQRAAKRWCWAITYVASRKTPGKILNYKTTVSIFEILYQRSVNIRRLFQISEGDYLKTVL